MNNTWEIMHIISKFNKRANGLATYTKEYSALEELYAQAIRLQCNVDYGHVFVADDFIDDVKNGFFIDYDGCGCWLDDRGNRQDAIRCNTKWLLKNRGDYKFICWFNK